MEPGERSRYEMGGYLKLNFKKDFSEEISYAVRLDLFSISWITRKTSTCIPIVF